MFFSCTCRCRPIQRDKLSCRAFKMAKSSPFRADRRPARAHRKQLPVARASHLCNGKLIPSSPLFQAYERGAVAVVALAAGRVVPLRDLC